MASLSQANRRIVTRSVLAAVAMFGFGYALVPLYDVICDAFGINGRTGVTTNQSAFAQGVDETRTITVQFTSHTSEGLPWEFGPEQRQIEVHPGEVIDIAYVARNKSLSPVYGRASYSVAPARAAVHFKKTECFCFSNQLLNSEETKRMPVRFVVERDVPDDVYTITLSYSFFNAKKYLSDEEKLTLSGPADQS